MSHWVRHDVPFDYSTMTRRGLRYHISTTSLPAACLVTRCLAGVMSPIVIINYSQQDINLDFTFPSKCIYTDFDPDYLYKYYSAFRSKNLVADHGSDYADLDTNLQAFKNYTGIQDLQQSLYGATDIYKLPAYIPGETVPYSVHQIEMDGSRGCVGKDSWKQFQMKTAAGTYVYEIKDSSTSNWEITKYLGNGPFTVDIGKGGYLGKKWAIGYGILGAVVVIAVVALVVVLLPGAAAGAGAVAETGIGGFSRSVVEGWSLSFSEGEAGSIGDLGRRQESSSSATVQSSGIAITATLDDDGTTTAQVIVPDINALQVDGTDTDGSTPATIYGWYDLYQRIDLENRQACVLSHPALQNQDCWVAGTSIIIQADGSTVAHPLPDVSQAL